jgi:Fe-S cluster assembly protein SufD
LAELERVPRGQESMGVQEHDARERGAQQTAQERGAAGAAAVITGLRPRVGEPRWLTDLRLRALDRYDHLSWPTPQEEEWRRTDVTEIDFGRFAPREPADDAQDSRRPELTGEGSERAPGGASPEKGAFAGRARFEGGRAVELALDPALQAGGVRLVSLADWGGEVGEAQQALQGALEGGFRGLDNRFQAWHYTTLSHGLFLYVPPFVELTGPFLVELVETGSGVVSAPHLAVVLDRGARAKVLVRTVGSPAVDAAGQLLVNLGMDLVVGEAAGLELYHLQDLPTSALSFAHGSVRVARDARLLTFEAALGSGLLKSRLDCSLDGPGAEAFLHGIYLSRERQHMDIRTVQRHRAPNATSRAFYKGALKDASRSIYQGLIEVTPQASKTDAYLTDRNLILNDGARADSIPSLRIDTNDVKCSHGSTTGKIDPGHVFYLMSRGLNRSEAERMLIQGYFEELLGNALPAFAEELRELVDRRIGEGAGEAGARDGEERNAVGG